MGEIRWTDKSVQHLEAIYDYIAHDSKVYASRFVKALINSTSILENQPLAGRIVPEINEESIREIFHKDYRIVYKGIDKDLVEILPVYHGAMNLKNLKIEE